MKATAVIPARGGSKGIPRKNLKDIGGKPLIAWTIESASKSQYVSEIIVSTDDQEIADVARQHGAEISWRIPELCGDDIPIQTVYQDEILKIKNQVMVGLAPTHPFRAAGMIDNLIRVLCTTKTYDLCSLRNLITTISLFAMNA